MSGADLGQCEGVDAEFGRCIAQRTSFKSAKLDYARFENADLRESSFRSASLIWANFDHAKLDKSVFMDANLSHASLHRASVGGCHMSRARLDDIRYTDPERERAEEF